MEEESGKFYGKYRGTVFNNIDPDGLGRIQVVVKAVSGETPIWAMPCFPWAGLQMGMYLVPPVHASVWIEYEGGDTKFAIWVGCFWENKLVEFPKGTMAQTTPGAPVVVIQSISQSGVVISDVPIPPMKAPGVMLFSGPSSIALDVTGITITAPLINLVGAKTDINNGALIVI